jgi:PLP dependent protein
MSDAIAERIAKIRQQLPPSVRLIAVTKQVSVAAIRSAYGAGIRDFGENRIQEAETKQDQLQDLEDITWHLIGHLQSNKAKKALELFPWIHSVDSLKLFQRLEQLAAELSCQPEILLQVKLRSDPNKHGWTIPELMTDLPVLNQGRHLRIRGLMVIPPAAQKDEEILAIFHQGRELADKIKQQNWSSIQMEQLSMGMSADYPLAVQAGATMVRLGQIIFGERVN